jgi:hypothetical protein
MVGEKWYMMTANGESAATPICQAASQCGFLLWQSLPLSLRLWLRASQKQQCGAQRLLHIVHQVAVVVEEMRGSGTKSR